MRVTGFVVAAMVLAGGAAFAQGIQPADVGTNNVRLLRQALRPSAPADPPREVGTDETDANRTCRVFIWNKPGSPVEAFERREALLACLGFSNKVFADEAGIESADHTALIGHHVNYKRLKEWVEQARKGVGARPAANSAEWEAKRAAVDELQSAAATLRNSVHGALEAHDLSLPLSAMLFTGAAVSDVANDGADAGGGAGASSAKPGAVSAGPAAMIVFESPHFGEEGARRVHVAFGGKFGFQQVMSMVKATAADGKPDPEALPVADYKDGLLWGVGGSAYTVTSGRSEAFARVSIGGTRVGDARSVIEGANKEAFLAIPVDTDGGISAARWEMGFGWNYYGRAMEYVHLDKSLLNPVFSAYGLRRSDNRLRGAADLAAFVKPEVRWVYGISVNIANLLRSDGESFDGLGKRTFGFGFAVEREFAPGSGLRIPDSTRYILRGSVDILNALTGGGKEPAQGASAK